MRTRRIDPAERAYPAVLAELSRLGDWPRLPCLYVRGELPLVAGLAVVGSRGASAEAIDWTGAEVRKLAKAGIVVWSGGAYGIDAAAHRAALGAGAPTVVVTAGGLDSAYPPDHADLYRQVLAEGGALVSLQADGERRGRHQFLRRNAVLSALTVGTLVVEARARGGAACTAAIARRLGRPLLLVPAAPWSEQGAGSAVALAAGGAEAVISADGVLASLSRAERDRRVPRSAPTAPLVLPRGRGRQSPRRGESSRLPAASPSTLDPTRAHEAIGRLEPRARTVYDAVAETASHFDDVCERAGLPTATVGRCLGTLCLEGLLEEDGPGHYRRARAGGHTA